MDIKEYCLPNGIRLVHHQVPGPVSHCGLIINAGTRDELEEEHGMAHFIEHVIFKGTEKRNLYQVLNRLENVGADLNAYTTKEETCIYATFLNQYYERTLELISDICFHPSFPQKELDKEKEVIIDEIKSYLDTPSEQIFDDFEDLIFEGHPLGYNILGTPKNVRKFRSNDARKFISRNYNTDQMVISSVGNISFDRILRLAQKHFSMVPANLRSSERRTFGTYHPRQRTERKKTYQTHCIIGVPAYSLKDEKRYVLAFMNNILGGPILNSRLSIALREKNGLTYHIESNYVPFSDTGIFSIYFGTDNNLMEKARDLVEKELSRLRNSRISQSQLQVAKKQLIGQVSISNESKINLMLSMGKSYLFMDDFLSLEEIVKKIESITPGQILETANEVLEPDRLSRLIFSSAGSRK